MIDAQGLREQVAHARAARRPRPIRAVAEALAAAATTWADDADLRACLPDATRLSAPMIAAVLPRIARPLAVTAMCALADAVYGPGASERPPPDGPAVVAHVLASNVPGLAVPAIALGLLGGAAVVLKSGRADPRSAPAFVRALARTAPELAATVVAATWPGGSADLDGALADAADVLVATGRDETVRALAGRAPRAFVGHGERTSVAVIAAGSSIDAEDVAARLAEDIALYDQRGCLSPVAVYLESHEPARAEAFADQLAAALDRCAIGWPLGPLTVPERAARRTWLADVEWAGGRVRTTAGGVVVTGGIPGLATVPVIA